MTEEQELKYTQEKVFELLKAFKEVCDKEHIWYSLAYGSVLGAVRHKGFIPWDTDADVCILLPDKEKVREAFRKHHIDGIRLKNHDEEKKCTQSHDSLVFDKPVEVEGLHLDIFPLVGAPSDPKEQQKFARYSSKADKIVRSKYVKLRLCKPKNKPIVFCVKCLEFFIPTKCLKKNIYKREHKYDYDSAEYLITLSNYGNAKSCISKELLLETTDCEFNGVNFKIPKDYDRYLRNIYGDDYMTPKKY